MPAVSRVLTVNSSNPESGVSIVVSPPDTTSSQDAPTSFTRTYSDKTEVALVAPATAGGNNFDKWQKNGVDLCVTLGTAVILDAAHTMTAVYVTPEPPIVDPPDPPESPTLQFHLDGNHLILEWDEPDFVLQETADINDPESWVDYVGANISPVSVEIDSTGSRFFRLRWNPPTEVQTP